MRGNITRRGKTTWCLKFDVGTDPATGKRLVRTVTVRGKRQDAEKELSRLVNAAHDGTLIEPSKITVVDYLRSWPNGTHGLSAPRAHRRQQLELRLALGQGKHEADALVFSTVEGAAFSPDGLSRNWRRTVAARGLPAVMLHALRHSHASALIASGLDVLTISRRLGHGSPVVTRNTYAHLFEKTDTAAATAIEAAMRTGPER